MVLKVTETCRDINELKVSAQLACKALFYECLKQGVNVFVTETYRSQARQNYLYEQGRTRPGQVVTWTKSSNHTPRLAWDIAVCPPKTLYDTKTLEKVGAIAKTLGITWGGTWVNNLDRPHFEVKESWVLPSKYDKRVIEGVKVPTTSNGVVKLTVSDDPYKDKIGYNIIKDAKKFRLMSGPMDKTLAYVTKYDLIDGKYLAYAELAGPANDKYRIQSGAYTTLEAAELAARNILKNDQLIYVSINGTLK